LLTSPFGAFAPSRRAHVVEGAPLSVTERVEEELTEAEAALQAARSGARGPTNRGACARHDREDELFIKARDTPAPGKQLSRVVPMVPLGRVADFAAPAAGLVRGRWALPYRAERIAVRVQQLPPATRSACSNGLLKTDALGYPGNGRGKMAKELVGTGAVAKWLSAGDPKGPVIIQGADLTGFASELSKVDLARSTLFGCAITEELRQQVSRQGAQLLPDTEALPRPLRCFPTQLYDVAWLYDGFDPAREDSWKGTPDHKGWTFFMSNDEVTPNQLDLAQSAAARLHDTAMERATARFLADHGAPAVAIMGGHDVRRDAPTYRQVVQIARDLRRKGYLIVTGGGPGLMEAGNLGAFLATESDGAIDEALANLPERNFKSHDWLATAAAVRARFNRNWSSPIGKGQTSLAIPTWLYGHEPPNLFSSHVAKLFHNSLREDGLVTIASGGIIFGPGNAGTVQEIFQDLTQNYYRGSLSATPMVFLSPAYWNRPCDDVLTFPPRKNPNKPLLPLVRQLAAEKDFLSAILASDDVAEIIKFLDRAPPKPKPGLRLADARLKSRFG